MAYRREQYQIATGPRERGHIDSNKKKNIKNIVERFTRVLVRFVSKTIALTT